MNFAKPKATTLEAGSPIADRSMPIIPITTSNRAAYRANRKAKPLIKSGFNTLPSRLVMGWTHRRHSCREIGNAPWSPSGLARLPGSFDSKEGRIKVTRVSSQPLRAAISFARFRFVGQRFLEDAINQLYFACF